MEQNKPKCKCAQRAGMCGRKLSLIKLGKLAPDTIDEEMIICPLKSVLTHAS